MYRLPNYFQEAEHPMRLIKTLLASALALSSLSTFADALLTFEPADFGATPPTAPAFLNGSYFGGFEFNGNGVWTTSNLHGCGGSGNFETHGPDDSNCGALNLAHDLTLDDPNADPVPHSLIIKSPNAFSRFEFWWSQNGGDFTVKFMDINGNVVEGDNAGAHQGIKDCDGTQAYCRRQWVWQGLDVVNAWQVEFDFGLADGYAMIDDLKFISNTGGNNVPEPTGGLLAMAGLGALALTRRRAKKG
jgi:MYXO-CTERM domain-containing protein